jgi:hypothetical protein
MNNQDIVTELRKWADSPIKSPAISKALREGANEIERLRAQTLQSDTNIVRTPQERSTEEIVERVLALNHPDAADAADEIERLQDLILDQSDKIEDLRYKISKIQKKLQETVIEAYRG